MTKRVSLTPGPSAKFVLAVPSDLGEFSATSSDELVTIGSDKSQTRFKAPVIWERTTTGYRITDLHRDHIKSALNLLHSSFFLEEPLCSATSLSKDIDSLKSYRRFVRNGMSEGNSICAIREGDGIVVGLAVMSTSRKSYEEEPDTQGEALAAMLALEKQLFIGEKVNDTIDQLGKYLRIDALCVRPDHRGKCVGTSLLRSCVAKSRSIGVSACIGLFSSDISQRIAARLGFEKLGEIPYRTYVDGISDDNPFVEIAQENYCLACMAVKINANSSSTFQQSPISRSASSKPLNI